MTSQPLGTALVLGMAMIIGTVLAWAQKKAFFTISLGRPFIVSLPVMLLLLAPQICYSGSTAPTLYNINNGRSITWTNAPANPATSDLDITVLGIRNIFGGHNIQQVFSLNQPIGAVGTQVINNQTTLDYFVAVPPGGTFAMSFTPAWLANTEFNFRWSFPAAVGDPFLPPEILQQGDFTTDNNAVPINVPEPSAFRLFGIGVLGLFIYSFWHRRKFLLGGLLARLAKSGRRLIEYLFCGERTDADVGG